jgi:hypothetical protein
MDAGSQPLTLDSAVTASDPSLIAGIAWAADDVVASKIGEARGCAVSGEIRWGCYEEAPCALKLLRDETRIRKVADSKREVRAFSDQILITI